MNDTYLNSPMNEINYLGMKILIKRDDLLSKEFSGNKARKLYYYLNENIKFTKIISYGSMQSNNMLSLSYLAKLRKVDFIYYTNRSIEFINKHKDTGNLKQALLNGMILKSIEEYEEMKLLVNLNKGITDNTLYIVEGGAQEEAIEGLNNLALELEEYIILNNIKNPKIFLPSGTGSSALYLQKNFKYPVYTTPIVGTKEYLISEFNKLDKSIKQPIVLDTIKKYKYGKLYEENYTVIKNIKKETGLQFEYVYDSKGWITIEENLKEFENSTLIYIHCGGLLGNELMEERYKEKYLLD